MPPADDPTQAPDDPEGSERHRADEALRDRLQQAQAELERRRRAPLVRAALALDRRLPGGRGGLRAAVEPPAGLDGTADEAAADLGRRQLRADLAREEAALDRLRRRPLPALADRATAAVHRLGTARARSSAPSAPAAAPGRPGGPVDPAVVLTVAAPTRRAAPRWGDWHLAVALAGALDRAGVPAAVQPADEVASATTATAQVHVVVRGLRQLDPTPGPSHVLWIISHPEQVTDHELDAADLVLVASERFADHLVGRTASPVEVLLQATDPRRFHPVPADPALAHELVVVANARHERRPAVAAALAAGLRPAILGSGWDGLVPPELVAADHVPNEDLVGVYASAGLVLADHWGTMRAWGFVGNRLLDVLACGAPVTSDHLPEIADLLGDAVPTWRTPDELARVVAEHRADPAAARRRAQAGRRRVLADHTVDHRAAQLCELLGRHGLLSAAGP